MGNQLYTYKSRSTGAKDLSCHEIVEANQVLEQEEITQSKALFVPMVLHKFRTQLDTISFFASFLKLENHQWTEQKKFQYLDNIQTVIKQLSQLMDEVLTSNGLTERQQVLAPPLVDNATFSTLPYSIWPSIPQLSQVFDFIEANYDQQITVYSVAQAVGYSATYLSNLVKSKTGRTIHSWIVERRMVKARVLLLETDWTVNRIAAAVGYPDSGHFIRQFRQLYNTTPKSWRNIHRRQNEAQ